MPIVVEVVQQGGLREVAQGAAGGAQAAAATPASRAGDRQRLAPLPATTRLQLERRLNPLRQLISQHFSRETSHGPHRTRRRTRTTTTITSRTASGRWVSTTNHKDIGTLYLMFSCIMFFIGGSFAMLIRAELFKPGLQFLRSGAVQQMTTMHALVMIFGAIMPAFVGLANWMIPMQVGAPDMALPRMNNFSFWILPFAFTLLLSHAVRARRRPGRRLDHVSAAGRCRPATRCR